MCEIKNIKKEMADARRVLTESSDKDIALLEREWARYKYLILGRNPEGYKNIRALLKDKSKYPVHEFFSIVDGALALPENRGWQINAAQHIAGYFKKTADEREKSELSALMAAYSAQRAQLHNLKSALYQLAIKYSERYILESYYFWDI